MCEDEMDLDWDRMMQDALIEAEYHLAHEQAYNDEYLAEQEEHAMQELAALGYTERHDFDPDC